MDWRSFDLKTLEREYSPSSVIGGNYQPYIAAYQSESAQAFRTLSCQRGLRYGPGPRAWLDYFPAAQKDAELLVFIHGGYWQELSKNESAFLAPAWLASGRAHCVLDYDLAPAVSLEEIVQQCQEGLRWLFENAGLLGFDPAKVIVAGSSAGAHLAAMLCLSNPEIKGAILLSGIYELEPLVATYVNQALGLDNARARALSPGLLLSKPGKYDEPLAVQSTFSAELSGLQAEPSGSRKVAFPPCLIAWGEHETAEFKRQSQAFAAKLCAMGVKCEAFEVADRNHFDVANALGIESEALFRRATHFF
jgi:arylformamidase